MDRVQIPERKVKKKSPKRTIEIVASVSGVIPTGNYENYKPMYSAKEIVQCNGNADEIIETRSAEIKAILDGLLKRDYERIRLENIVKNREDIRWRQKGDKFYPSVTSIISAVEPINFDPDLLKQYASRGSLVHKQISHYFTTGVWEEDILQIPDTKLDYMIVTQGSLKLDWRDCNFMGFWEKNNKDFLPYDFVEGQDTTPPSPTDYPVDVELFNDDYLFSGEADMQKLYYQSKVTLPDYKTGAVYTDDRLLKYWKQLSAYARTLGGVEQMMIIPLNPKNKSGFGKPIIETDIDKYFNLFLQDRSAFKKIYGV